MKIKKTDKSSEGKAGALRAKGLGIPKLQADKKGSLAVETTVWVPNAEGGSDEHQVTITDGDIERLLTRLANPTDAESAKAVSKLMRENLRSALRLVALGTGTQLVD